MNIELLKDKGKLALVNKEFQIAIDAFGDVLAQEPDNKMALFSRGTARFRVEDFEGAVEDFTAYIALNDSNEKVYCSRGTANLSLKRYEEAMDDFNRSIEISEFYPSAYFGRAELFFRTGDKEQGKLDYDLAAKLLTQRGQSLLEGQGIMFQDPNT